MKRHFIAALLALLLLAGCEGKPSKPFTLTFPEGTPQATVELVRAALPGIERSCPGLLKYWGALTFVEVQPDMPYSPPPGAGLPASCRVTWLVFAVSEDASLPKEYRASGQVCPLGVESTGAALILQKAASQAVFLDRPVKDTGRDLVLPLR